MTKQNRIQIIDSEIQLSLGRANYWVHFATSKANQSRKIFSGILGNTELNEIEKEKDAFEIANNHFNRVQDLINEKYKLLNNP